MAQNNNPSVQEKSLEAHTSEAVNLANSARQIEVTSVEAPRTRVKVRLGRASLALAAATTVIGAGAASLGDWDASARPDQATKNDGMVQIESPDSMTPWELAQDVKDKDADLREVASAIQEQADSQGYQGVDAGELFVLPDEFVSEEAEKLYAPEEELPR